MNYPRLRRETREILKDFAKLCELHSELYDHVSSSEYQRLDKWESDLCDDVYAFKGEMEKYSPSLKNIESSGMERETVSEPRTMDPPRMVTRSESARAASNTEFSVPVNMLPGQTTPTERQTGSLNTRAGSRAEFTAPVNMSPDQTESPERQYNFSS